MVDEEICGVDGGGFFLDDVLFAETTQSSFSMTCAESYFGSAMLRIVACDHAGNQMNEE